MAINWWCYGYPDNLNVFITIVPVKRAILRPSPRPNLPFWLVKPPFLAGETSISVANPWWMPLVICISQMYPHSIPQKIYIISKNSNSELKSRKHRHPQATQIRKNMGKTWYSHDLPILHLAAPTSRCTKLKPFPRRCTRSTRPSSSSRQPSRLESCWDPTGGAMSWEISGEHTMLNLFLYMHCNTLLDTGTMGSQQFLRMSPGHSRMESKEQE